MAKFSSINDVKFQRVISVLRRWVEEGPKVQPVPEHAMESDTKATSLLDGLIFDEQYQECLKSLNFAEARDRLQDVKPAYERTYEWLFGRQVGFGDWLQGKDPSNMYWIHGKPGSGKSTVMKFIMGLSLTRQLLEAYDRNDWLIAGYFFHNRGTTAQKSIVSFLNEILFQLLAQRKELFSLVYALFSRLYENQNRPSQLGGRSQNDSSILWSIAELQEALLSIGSKSASDTNVCLFVDTLDEHDGNHRELLSVLSRLAKLTENPCFRLRLCLAGRPENIFKDAFLICPKFAIHEHTADDIRLYAEGRMEAEKSADLTPRFEHELHSLTQDIVEKSHGVFMWVRLVVDELVEACVRATASKS